MSILVYLIKVNLAVVLSMLIGSGLKFRHLFRSMKWPMRFSFIPSIFFSWNPLTLSPP
jgi:hypothetical protein